MTFPEASPNQRFPQNLFNSLHPHWLRPLTALIHELSTLASGRLHLLSNWKICRSALFSIPVNKMVRYTSLQGHWEDKTSMRVRWVIDRADDRTSKLWAKLFHCHHQNKCQSQVSSNFYPLRGKEGLEEKKSQHLTHWVITPCFQSWQCGII